MRRSFQEVVFRDNSPIPLLCGEAAALVRGKVHIRTIPQIADSADLAGARLVDVDVLSVGVLFQNDRSIVPCDRFASFCRSIPPTLHQMQ